MNKHTSLILAIFVLSLNLLPNHSLAANHQKTFRQATVPIVAFEPPINGNGPNSRKFTIYGTGFVFQWNRRVITCASVLDSIPSKHFLPKSYVGVLVKPRGSQKSLLEAKEFHAIKVTAIDRKLDIALLETEADLPIKPLSRSSDKIEVASNLAITSFHKSRLIPTYYENKVSSTFKANGMSYPYCSLSAPIGQGTHGSPAFDKTTGSLLGIIRIHTRLLNRTVHSLPGYESEGLATAVVIPTGNLLEMINNVPKQP